ncbi:hypothetical protein ACFL6Y_02795 [Elusimicrobiota bacterium]
MHEEIKHNANRIIQALQETAGNDPSHSEEVMHLKLKLELSASKIFLALGWLVANGKIAIEPSEFGYRVSIGKLANIACEIKTEQAAYKRSG